MEINYLWLVILPIFLVAINPPYWVFLLRISTNIIQSIWKTIIGFSIATLISFGTSALIIWFLDKNPTTSFPQQCLFVFVATVLESILLIMIYDFIKQDVFYIESLRSKKVVDLKELIWFKRWPIQIVVQILGWQPKYKPKKEWQEVLLLETIRRIKLIPIVCITGLVIAIISIREDPPFSYKGLLKSRSTLWYTVEASFWLTTFRTFLLGTIVSFWHFITNT